jgi:hypothetical protein
MCPLEATRDLWVSLSAPLCLLTTQGNGSDTREDQQPRDLRPKQRSVASTAALDTRGSCRCGENAEEAHGDGAVLFPVGLALGLESCLQFLIAAIPHDRCGGGSVHLFGLGRLMMVMMK